jgi:hypothetical protein
MYNEIIRRGMGRCIQKSTAASVFNLTHRRYIIINAKKGCAYERGI